MVAPRFSIITVTYNAGQLLERTIESVLAQTSFNYEYIILDGQSKDNTLEIIKKYEHHINKWISEPDNGIYDAMNKAIDIARGEYILFLNAGDTFHSE
ncbi:MAG: glycosyltransferase, partial [Bacteroidales bacterium]